MIQSMTAFARVSAQGEWGSATWEIRSVNHRYCDLTLRLPEHCRDLEGQLREYAKQQLNRGKIDCQCQFEPGPAVGASITLNQPLVESLVNAANTIAERAEQVYQLNPLDIMRWPGVVSTTEQDLAIAQQQVVALFEQAVAALLTQRQREGEALAAIITQRCEGIQAEIDKLLAIQPTLSEQQRERLRQRVADLSVDVDETRLEQEVAIIAQKADIAEEIDRLQTHLHELQRIIKQGGVVGRRMDFLIQECHREANTISAKATDLGITQSAVELKVLIEQMREQVQNIE